MAQKVAGSNPVAHPTKGPARGLFPLCAPGMGECLRVKVPCGGWPRATLDKGKGVCSDAESEGSRRQSCNSRNTNLVGGTDVWASLRHKAKPEIGQRATVWIRKLWRTAECGPSRSVVRRDGG